MGYSVENCSSCGEAKLTHYVTADGKPVCEDCFMEKFNAVPCSQCGEKKRIASIGKDGPVCYLCFYKLTPQVSCVRCGRLVSIVMFGLCERCLYEQPKQQRQKRKRRQKKQVIPRPAPPPSSPPSEPSLAPVVDSVDLPASIEDPLEADLEAAIEQALASVGITLAALSVDFPSGAMEKAKQEARDWLISQVPDMGKQHACALAYIGGIIALRVSSWVKVSSQEGQKGRAQKVWGEKFQEAKDQGFEEEDLLLLNRAITASIPSPSQGIPIRV